ncbi:hypothetical protein ACFL3Q_12230 [Planctomycetota bacterium]
MKKIAAISACCAVLISGLVLVFNNSSGQDTPVPEPAQPQTPARVEIAQESPVELQAAEPVEPQADDDFPITKEQFEQLSQDDQNEMLEEFVADFWQGELAAPEAPAREKKYISLDIFNHPYMQTITEREFFELSPEDQEKAMTETTETLRDIRVHVFGMINQAKESMANNDYLSTEAHLIYGLEVGRELSANKDGMFITRLVGIACQKASLNEMVKLYTKAGDFSKVQVVQEQLQDIELEVDELRRTAIEAEANR